jgi:hypothetical protein
MQVLTMKKIIVDKLFRDCLRALFVIQTQVCKAPCIIAQGTFCLSIDRKTLA